MDKPDTTFFFAEQPEKLTAILDKMVEIAKPENAFTKPVQSENYTVIGVSEVMASMGMGFGGGVRSHKEGKSPDNGGGGGGGGMSSSRPVATIVIGPNGVNVQPVFDFTKIAIAAITTVGSMIIFMAKVLKNAR